VDYDSNAAARKLTVPLRAINGDLFPTDVARIRTVKGDFDSIVMKHMGHYPMMERPGEFNALVRMTVEQLEGKAKSTKDGLVYERLGSGPAVVLIHASFLDRRLWAREFEWLRTRAAVVRYDQRGHGESPLPTVEYSPVDDLLALLDDLKIDQATLVGLSSGAQLALDAALAAPGRVRQVVMAAPAISGYVERDRPPFMKELAAALQAQDYARATEIMLATPVYAAPPESRDLVRTMLKGNERLWGIDPRLVRRPSKPALERLEAVTVPVVVLVGGADVPAMIEQAEILERRVPNVRVVRINGGGHLLNLTSPNEFQRALEHALQPVGR
jgi:pimeloyl-ACP methyl ester carboxylesterase